MTAVEWLNRQIRLNSKIKENSKAEISFTIGLSKIDELFKQAEKMEKDQIKNAYESLQHRHGENYYNETFKNKIT